MKIVINNITFEVDSQSNLDFWKYVNKGKWETETFTIIDKYVSESSNALDLGCWIGPITLYMAAKGAQVMSIDPDPVAFAQFEKNVAVNPSLSKNIEARNIAVDNVDGAIKIHARSGYGNSSTSLLKRVRDEVEDTTVKAFTLENILENRKVDFIKIDIEGGEFRIIDSFFSCIHRNDYPTMLISMHYNHLNEYIYQNRVKSKFVSLVMMKIEKWTKKHFFSNELAKHIDKVIALAKAYKYVYDTNGKLLTVNELNSTYLLHHKIDLLFTNMHYST